MRSRDEPFYLGGIVSQNRGAPIHRDYVRDIYRIMESQMEMKWKQGFYRALQVWYYYGTVFSRSVPK